MATVVVDLSQTSSSPANDRQVSTTTSPNVPAADEFQTTIGTPAVPVKRGPGRPKGSGKKQRTNVEPSSISKVKRPVGRPRKDGLPAGSLLPPKDKRPAGRPRKSAPAKLGGSLASSQVQGQQQVAPTDVNITASSQSGNAIPYGASVTVPNFAAQPQPPSAAGGVQNKRWQASVTFKPAPPLSTHTPAVSGIDPVLDKDEWFTLLRTNEELFLHALISALSTLPNPPAAAGPTVEAAFRMHLVSLTPKENKQQSSVPDIPTLYSVMKTFWLPTSPAYFSLTASASTSRIPSEHRFIYWDPQPLVFNGISCPNCATPLTNKGRIKSGPMMIHDLGKPFYIIGCEYSCANAACKSTSGQSPTTFASTDARVLRALPEALRKEFPARLVKNVKPGLAGDGDLGPNADAWNWKALGVSTELWNMVRGSIAVGVGKAAILSVLTGIREGPPELPRTPVRDGEGEEDQVASSSNAQQNISATNPPQNSTTPTEVKETTTGAFFSAWRANTADSTPAITAATLPNPGFQRATAPVGEPVIMTAAPSGPFNANGTLSTLNYPFSSYYPPATTAITNISSSNGSGHMNTRFIEPFTGDPSKSKRTLTIPTASPGAASDSGSGSAPPGDASLKRVRHCCKCGSQECSGKRGRHYCQNPCQDCGKKECPGRNSKRPDKQCEAAWQ